MAKSGAANKPAKLTRAEKKAVRAERRAGRRETWSNMRQAFTLTRQNDSKLIPILVAVFVAVAAITYAVGVLVTSSPWLPIPFALILAVLATVIVFSRRAQTSMYSQAENQPGAAAWILQNQRRGDWRTTPAVAGNAQLDAVHRVIGRPGVLLVGEGAPQRVRGLVAQEKKKIARLTGDTPIYDIVVGTGEGQVPLKKLNSYLLKLPRNLSKSEVAALDKRLAALTTGRAPLPQGPMPQGAKMRNVQRTVRRRS